MNRDRARPRLRADATLAAAVDHVRLCYDYLNNGDLDGYASLFEAGTPFTVQGAEFTAPEQVDRLPRSAAGVSHAVQDVFGSDRRLAAVGRLIVGGVTYAFVDVFHISDRALLLDRQRYVAPLRPERPPER